MTVHVGELASRLPVAATVRARGLALLLLSNFILPRVLCSFLVFQVLVEQRQVLPDGRERTRNLPLAEKMIGGEPWRAAVLRAVSEELGSALKDPAQPEVCIKRMLQRVRSMMV